MRTLADVSLSFLTPWAAAVGVVVLVALWMLVESEIRARRVSRAIGLVPPGHGHAVAIAGAMLLVAVFVGAAAAQPVVSGIQPREGRTDAEAIFVFDVTRSMLAAGAKGSPSRLERARGVAKRIRNEVPELPVGVSTVTDRTLPHLFPSVSSNSFTAVVDRAIGIERPPPDRKERSQATSLSALAVLGQQNFFGAKSKRRVAVVFTDGESLPLDAFVLRQALQKAKVRLLFVHLWEPDERVFLPDGTIEGAYRPEPGTQARLLDIANFLGGRVFAEDDVGGVIDAIRRNVADGPMGPHGEELQSRSLAPHALGLAFLPLLFVLWRRNT